MIVAAVLAGGVGKRMGDIDKPKQFLEFGGKAIIVHTTEKFISHERVDHTVVLCPEEWIEYTKAIFDNYSGKGDPAGCISVLSDVPVIAGGKERNDTIMNAISYIEQEFGLGDDTVLITHDAVRPFVSEKMIDENIDLMLKPDSSGKSVDAVDTVVPATDTIVRSEDGEHIVEVPKRSELYQGQTPQTFRATAFREIYKSLDEAEKAILTDAIKAFVIKGKNVVIADGAATNIKVTYISDLEYAETMYNSLKNQ